MARKLLDVLRGSVTGAVLFGVLVSITFVLYAFEEIAPLATFVGLCLDILGFVLVFKFGHYLFSRRGSKELSEDEGLDKREKRHRFLAMCGAHLVVVGFGLQAMVAIADWW